MSANHMFLPEYESANGHNFKVDTMGLLMDIKVLLKEYYIATFAENGDYLQITFNNGQKFLLTIKEA